MGTAWAFVALAVGLTWLPWVAILATTGGPGAGTGSGVLWVLGGFGPALAAVVVAAGEGRAGLRRLAAGLRRWRVGRWYLLLLAPLPLGVAAVLLALWRGTASIELAGVTFWIGLPVVFVVMIVGGGLEEVGWRGYLLPRLQERRSALVASLIVGVVWTVWHLPLFFMDGTSQASFALGWYALHTLALAVLFTWAYNASGGSTLLAVLAHAALNTGYSAAVQGFAPETLDAFMPYAALLMIAAAVLVVWRHGPHDLAPRPRDVWSDAAGSASPGPVGGAYGTSGPVRSPAARRGLNSS